MGLHRIRRISVSLSTSVTSVPQRIPLPSSSRVQPWPAMTSSSMSARPEPLKTPNACTRDYERSPSWTGPPIKIGVIGGSGLYKLDGIEVVATLNPKTPWGLPSSPITIAKTSEGTHVAFLARHGLAHSITPSAVPSLANIAALKHLGVQAVLAFTAVGSLREEIAPRDFVVPSQIIDRTKGIRRASFFGEGDQAGVVGHAAFGDPFDEILRPEVEEIVRKTLQQEAPDVKTHGGKTLVAMEGPQFSTRAESLMYRAWGGDLINMSALPEAKLAREAELSYVIIATSTDYDAWRASEGAVDVAEVLKSLSANVANSHKVLRALLEPVAGLVKDNDAPAVKHAREHGMQYSIMTKLEMVSQEAKDSLRFVLPWYGQ